MMLNLDLTQVLRAHPGRARRRWTSWLSSPARRVDDVRLPGGWAARRRRLHPSPARSASISIYGVRSPRGNETAPTRRAQGRRRTRVCAQPTQHVVTQRCRRCGSLRRRSCSPDEFVYGRGHGRMTAERGPSPAEAAREASAARMAPRAAGGATRRRSIASSAVRVRFFRTHRRLTPSAPTCSSLTYSKPMGFDRCRADVGPAGRGRRREHPGPAPARGPGRGSPRPRSRASAPVLLTSHSIVRRLGVERARRRHRTGTAQSATDFRRRWTLIQADRGDAGAPCRGRPFRRATARIGHTRSWPAGRRRRGWLTPAICVYIVVRSARRPRRHRDPRRRPEPCSQTSPATPGRDGRNPPCSRSSRPATST